ncbi:MAG TPA: hypothetical protein VD858_01140 [Reyranella sp.]|nr:hypothetical protein [Reyranella sp.]
MTISRARGTILIWILIVICVGVTWLMYLFFFLMFGYAALHSANITLFDIFWLPLLLLWGTPVIAPCAGYAALYLGRSTRFPHLAVLPGLLLVASAIVAIGYWLPRTVGLEVPSIGQPNPSAPSPAR